MGTFTQKTNTTPSAPSSNYLTIYGKDDGLMYYMADDGVEHQFMRQDPGVLSPIGKNAIINGDMEIAQRGTSFAAIASATYSLDRWQYSKVGAMVHTITQDTDVPTVAQAGRLFTHSLKLALTTADTAIAAGDFCILSQSVEGYNWRAFAQRIITLSFWIKSPITGIHCATLLNSGQDRSCTKEYTINVVNTWEKKTLTFPASPSAGTWNYTNGIGAYVSFTLAVGSTFQGTADSYQSATLFGTSNQVNGVNTGITPYFITGVQLEAGSVATEFEGRQFDTEVSLCKRYCRKSYDLTVVPGTVTDTGRILMRANGTAHIQNISVAMRAAPTVTVYNPVTGASGTWRDINAGTDLTTSGAGGMEDINFSITSSVDQNAISGHYIAVSEL